MVSVLYSGKYVLFSMLNRNDVIKCDFVYILNNEFRIVIFSE